MEGCSECGATGVAAEIVGGRCRACWRTRLPPLEEAPRPYLPLWAGLASLLLPVVLPSLVAWVTGAARIDAIAKREEAGFWEPAHDRVRSAAVFGMILAAVVPVGLAAFAVEAVVARGDAGAGPVVLERYDELGEVLRALRSPEPARRQAAVEDLGALATAGFGAEDGLRLLDAAETHRDPAIRGALVRAQAMALIPLDRRAYLRRLEALYPEVAPEARDAVVSRVVEVDAGYLDDLAPEIVRRPPPTASPLSEALGEARADAAVALLGLPIDHPYRADALASLAERCATAPIIVGLQAKTDALLESWAFQREALGAYDPSLEVRLTEARATGITRALAPLRALACVADARADAAIEAAVADPDPVLAVGALEALGRGERPESATVRRLAADPIARGPLLRLLRRRGALDLVPASARTLDAVVETDLYASMPLGGGAFSIGRSETRALPDGGVARIVEVDFAAPDQAAPDQAALDQAALVLGPYDPADPRSRGAEARLGLGRGEEARDEAWRAVGRRMGGP